MKLKRVLSAAFAVMLLSSSLCFAEVKVQQVGPDFAGFSNPTMNAIYVPSGSGYTQYYSTASGTADAASEIAAKVGSATNARTPNRGLFEKLKDMGRASSTGTATFHGNPIYIFNLN